MNLIVNQPHNFNDAELATIMAYHPGQPAGYKNKTELTDGKGIYSKHQWVDNSYYVDALIASRRLINEASHPPI